MINSTESPSAEAVSAIGSAAACCSVSASSPLKKMVTAGRMSKADPPCASFPVSDLLPEVPGEYGDR